MLALTTVVLRPIQSPYNSKHVPTVSLPPPQLYQLLILECLSDEFCHVQHLYQSALVLRRDVTAEFLKFGLQRTTR